MSRDDDLLVSCRCGCTEIVRKGGYHTCDLSDAVEIGRTAAGLCRPARARAMRVILRCVVAGLVVLAVTGGVAGYVGSRERQRAEEASKWFNEGDRCLRVLNDDLGAIAAFTRALEIKPDARAYLFRGFACWRICNFEAAVADCDEALKLDPANEAALSNRKMASDALGRSGCGSTSR